MVSREFASRCYNFHRRNNGFAVETGGDGMYGSITFRNFGRKVLFLMGFLLLGACVAVPVTSRTGYYYSDPYYYDSYYLYPYFTGAYFYHYYDGVHRHIDKGRHFEGKRDFDRGRSFDGRKDSFRGFGGGRGHGEGGGRRH